MKTFLIVGILALVFTACSFEKIVVPSQKTKSIMQKYDMPYQDSKKIPKKWLCSSYGHSDNFIIHIEIEKNTDYNKVKDIILHLYENKNLKKIDSEKHLRQQKSVSYIRISKNKQVDIFNNENIDYSIIKSFINLQYQKYYEKFGTAKYKGNGTLIYKYGFIEPKNSNKSYFYTSFELNYKGGAYLANKNLVSGMDDVRIHSLLSDQKDDLEKSFIKKTLLSLKSNNIKYKYISDEYDLVKGKAGYKEISLVE